MGSFNRSSFNRAHFNRTSSHYVDVPTATVTGAGTVPTANMGVSAEATVTGVGTVLPLDWTTSVTATVTFPAVMYYQMIDWVLADIDAGITVTPEQTIETEIVVPDAPITLTPAIEPLAWTTETNATITLPAIMYYQMIDWVLADIDANIGVTPEETMGFGMIIEGNADTRLKFKFGVSPPEMP